MMKAEPVLDSDMVRLLPVGNPTFTDIRANGQIYVDKTNLIVALIKSYPFAFLVRPRRFGKTLLVSTIQTLFLKGRDAFRGLKASDLWDEPPKAVIRLDFSVIANARSGEEFRTLLDRLLEPELDKYFPPYAHENNPALRLNAALSPLPGKSVVVLIDEYDAPLSANIGRAEIFEAIKEEMCVFFEALKSLSGKIRFLFVTGIMNFRQTSLFSSFTKLKDLSLLPEFASLLGFTEEDVRTCFAPFLKYYAERKGISEAKLLSELRENYGGFCFDINGLQHVCSPWSILNYFQDDNPDFYGNYWVRSAGSISFVMNFLRNVNLLRPEDFDREYEVNSQKLDATEHITAARSAIVLANAGFLTIRRSEPPLPGMEGIGCDLKLGYPNIEVRRSMIAVYNAAYWPDTHERVDLVRYLQKAFEESSEDKVLTGLNSVVQHLDYQAFPIREEKNIHELLNIFFLGAGMAPMTEVHTPLGRSDLQIRTRTKTIVFEFKFCRGEDAVARGLLEDAKRQLAERNYGEPAPETDLLRIAAVFSEKKRRFVEVGFAVP